MLGRLKNSTNWTRSAGTAGADDIVAGDALFPTSTYTITSSPSDGSWTGSSSTDWFDCTNWEGFHVPDSTLPATINPVPAALNNCDINITASAPAKEYNNIARADSLTVLSNAILSLTGAGKEKLVVESGVKINTAGTLQFENNNNALTDSIFIHGPLKDNDPANTSVSTTGFQAGKGSVEMDDTRFAAIPASIEKPAGFSIGFQNLVMNNSRSVDVKCISNIVNNFNLQNGYLNITAPDGKLSLKSTCSVTSPLNIYGQANKGYQKSFVNGKMFYETSASTLNVPFPIGKMTATDTLFAPVEVTKTNSTPNIYNANYFEVPYFDLAVDPGQLYKVSHIEHWLISSDLPNLDAKVTLSWRPMSQIGDGIAAHDATALDSLMVCHYLDDDGVGPNPSLWHIDGGGTAAMPKNPGYNINYGLVTTIVSTGSFSTFPAFTLGTRSPFNDLPVSLLAFTAIPSANRINVKWETTNEQLLRVYEIEKSANGIDFIKLNSVRAFNNALNNYTTVDISPIDGWNYYRLKLIDNRNHISYSYIIKVWIGKTNKLLVYPNPAQKEIYLNLPGSRSNSDIVVVNSVGQVVKQLSASDLSLTVNIESLSKAVYWIKVFKDQQLFIQRFIKQ